MSTGLTTTNTMDGATLANLVCDGDLKALNNHQLVQVYIAKCESAGLDYRSKPFELLTLNGKKQFYATKECTSQIAKRDRITCQIVDQRTEDGVRVVTVRAIAGDGRQTDEIGCVTVANLKGDALCNAMMKATTKAKRRAVLSLGGLGIPDESELETIPGAQVEPLPLPPVNLPPEKVQDSVQWQGFYASLEELLTTCPEVWPSMDALRVAVKEAATAHKIDASKLRSATMAELNTVLQSVKAIGNRKLEALQKPAVVPDSQEPSYSEYAGTIA